MNWMQHPPEPSSGYDGRRAQSDDFLVAGHGCQVVARSPLIGRSGIPVHLRQRAPPSARRHRQRQGRWVAPPALVNQHEDRDFAQEGIQRAIKEVYNQARRSGNLRIAGMFPGLHEAGAVTGVLALACFVTGFIVAWLLRTGYVMAQTSWATEQMEHKVRYWQSEAIYARAVAGDALCQLAAITGQAPEPADWPGPDLERHRPSSS